MNLYCVKLSFLNNFRSKGLDISFEIEDQSIISEKEDRYFIEELEDGFTTRSNVVYKTDEEDVLSCGYAVLDTPLYASVTKFEGFAAIYTFDIEKGKQILADRFKEICEREVSFYQNVIEKVNALD